MGDKSEIQWTDATWNPVTGCSKVSPGCAHCYAETLTMRYAKGWKVPGLPWTPANAEQNVILKPHKLDEPLKWKKPRMIFVNSMSDLFHELVPDDYIISVFRVMAMAQRHVFQVLTKRPERMAELMPLVWATLEATAPDSVTFPLPNVWLGTSIENRQFVGRADALRATPAAVRFISAEPLLGPLVPAAECRYGSSHPAAGVCGTQGCTFHEPPSPSLRHRLADRRRGVRPSAPADERGVGPRPSRHLPRDPELPRLPRRLRLPPSASVRAGELDGLLLQAGRRAYA